MDELVYRDGLYFIQSPTLDALFDVYDEINTEVEMTELGVKVIQTSSNPKMVHLLQKHAAEVGVMANRGVEAVHKHMAGQSQKRMTNQLRGKI